ncbi:Leucine dehydrogenase [Koleobacter methoxysyntrophicus]|uniref:Leucine dehydrogenase n=1 Tax=Koleobacter methoxysyntrophicus TaxID=2751313 RepID=A0A8A0RRR6_9FIRM|nr:Glu/Leu/Phe/Val dehydrogenase [Koleobacter methoxysyntrophicus]MDK2901614.1 leucine dehydrogenase [Thermosediminibacterales bacterium]QSQ10067.1 Leucine dehydrogenase [Koleobacter methoxysyntrophicus]
MEIFKYMEDYDYEQLVFCHDSVSGLKAIIAIHDTTLGPALGGTRMWTYSTEDEAIIDALRLARGMTYKNAAMGLNLGGGKTVIIGNPKKDKSEELFRAFGRYVQSLGGRYITAEDVGITVDDMEIVKQETDYVVGLRGKSGDPSPVTAYGVYHGMKACAREVYGNESLKGKVIAVQGLGHVGSALCKFLYDEGARLIVTDIFEENVKNVVKEFAAEYVEPDKIYEIKCNIFSPCALGAVINDITIPKLKCDIIAGSANNQLKEPKHGDILMQKGILYAPDYVINGGGVINVAEELTGCYERERALAKVSKIYDKILKVIEISKKENIPTYIAADRMAEERIEKMGKIRSNYIRK